MTPELESAFYDLLAAARAVSDLPLHEGNLPRLDRAVMVIDEITESPPTQRMPSSPLIEQAKTPSRRPGTVMRAYYRDTR